MPIKGRSEVDVFQKDFRFVPIAENFGSVVLVKNDKEQQTSSMVVHIFGCWPILAIIMLMTSVMGIFVWIAVSAVNSAACTYRVTHKNFIIIIIIIIIIYLFKVGGGNSFKEN